MMPGMIEHYTSAQRELQFFQMRENSVFWTCPTPNQTETKNPWNVLNFTPKYIICPMCKFEIPKKVFITHPTVLQCTVVCILAFRKYISTIYCCTTSNFQPNSPSHTAHWWTLAELGKTELLPSLEIKKNLFWPFRGAEVPQVSG